MSRTTSYTHPPDIQTGYSSHQAADITTSPQKNTSRKALFLTLAIIGFLTSISFITLYLIPATSAIFLLPLSIIVIALTLISTLMLCYLSYTKKYKIKQSGDYQAFPYDQSKFYPSYDTRAYHSPTYRFEVQDPITLFEPEGLFAEESELTELQNKFSLINLKANILNTFNHTFEHLQDDKKNNYKACLLRSKKNMFGNQKLSIKCVNKAIEEDSDSTPPESSIETINFSSDHPISLQDLHMYMYNLDQPMLQENQMLSEQMEQDVMLLEQMEQDVMLLEQIELSSPSNVIPLPVRSSKNKNGILVHDPIFDFPQGAILQPNSPSYYKTLETMFLDCYTTYTNILKQALRLKTSVIELQLSLPTTHSTNVDLQTCRLLALFQAINYASQQPSFQKESQLSTILITNSSLTDLLQYLLENHTT